jgi:hypothetical protein
MIYPIEDESFDQTRPVKRVISTSRGNVHSLGGKNKKVQSSFLEDDDDLEKEERLIDQINHELCYCCAYGGYSGCLHRAFSTHTRDGVNCPSVYEICEMVKEFRSEVESKKHSPELYNYYTTQIFRQCISNVMRRPDETVIFTMDYKIFGKRVCKKAFAFVHGITLHHLKSISNMLKVSMSNESNEVPRNVVHQSGHRKFRDKDLPDYNYVTAENIFKENLRTTSIGM